MIKTFNGKKLKIREMNRSDLKRAKDFLDFINSLVEEEAMILEKKKKNLREEKEWLKNQLKEIREKKRVAILAEDGNKIVGICDCRLGRGRQSHVGEITIGVRKGYQGIGLGKFLFGEILELAKRKLRPKFFQLSVFEGNEIAKNLYKKFGFKEVAKIPKQIEYKGKLISEIVMIKEAK